MVEASNNLVVNPKLTSAKSLNIVTALTRARFPWCLEWPKNKVLATIVASKGTSKGTVSSTLMILELAEDGGLAEQMVEADLAKLAGQAGMEGQADLVEQAEEKELK